MLTDFNPSILMDNKKRALSRRFIFAIYKQRSKGAHICHNFLRLHSNLLLHPMVLDQQKTTGYTWQHGHY